MSDKNQDAIKRARMNAAKLRARRVREAVSPPEPTIEDKILESPLVNNPVTSFGARAVQALGKLGAHVVTPVSESTRGAVRGTRQLLGQDVSDTSWQLSDLAKELQDPLGPPHPEGGVSPLIRESNKLLGEPLSSEPTIRPQWKQFPKTAALVEHFSSPLEAASMAAEIAIPAAPLVSTGKLGGVTRTGARTAEKAAVASKDVIRSITKGLKDSGLAPADISSWMDYFDRRGIIDRWVKSSASDRGVYQSLAESGKINDVIDLLDSDLSYARPLGMVDTLDRIEGPVASAPRGPHGSTSRYYRDTYDGEIGKLASEQRGIIGDLDPMKVDYRHVSADNIKSSVKDKLGRMTPEQEAQVDRFLDNQLHAFYENQSQIDSMNRRYRLEDRTLQRNNEALSSERLSALSEIEKIEAALIERLESIPERSSSVGGRPGINPEYQSAQNDLRIVLEQKKRITNHQPSDGSFPEYDYRLAESQRIGREINDLMESGSVGSMNDLKLGHQQNYLSDLNRMRTESNASLSHSDFSKSPAVRGAESDAAKNLAGHAGEVLEQAILDQMGPAALEQYMRVNKGMSQRMMLRDLYQPSRSGVVSSPSLEGNPVTKAASGIVNARQGLMMYGLKAQEAARRFGANVVAPLADASYPIASQMEKIPRDIESIMVRRKIIGDLINQEVGLEAAETFMAIEDPNSIKEYLRQLEEVHPNLFISDEYRRFDGEIKDPVLKNKALEDTLKSPVSVFDRARTVNELLLNNRLQGQNQAS